MGLLDDITDALGGGAAGKISELVGGGLSESGTALHAFAAIGGGKPGKPAPKPFGTKPRRSAKPRKATAEPQRIAAPTPTKRVKKAAVKKAKKARAKKAPTRKARS